MRTRLTIALLLASLLSASAGDIIPFRSGGWKYRLGTQEASNPSSVWRANEFNDTTWSPSGGTANAPIGYPSSDASALEGSIQTLLPNGVVGSYICVFLRKAFVVADPGEFTSLKLQVQYDDGVALWLNGTLVGSLGVTEPFTVGTLAFDHEVTVDEPVLTLPAGLLRAGTNVLAVQVFNSNQAGSDLFFDARLASVIDAAPVVASVYPPPSPVQQSLTFINVVFNENVTGVDAADLLINSVAATSVVQNNPRDYTFSFPEPPTGAVSVAWIANPGIQDVDGDPTAFVPSSPWVYSVDPSLELTAVISEFMADNVSGIKDDDGARSDWIEIHNPGIVALSLEGWSLTDSRINLTKWRFPNVIVPPRGYLLVWASEKDRANPVRPLHTNFKLDKGGEYLALVDANANVVSEFAPLFPAQLPDRSYGRDDGDPSVTGYYETPTPGVRNATSGPGFAPEPAFSVASGVFTNDTITVELSAVADEIRYTLDGSVPTNTSPVYTGPITVGSNSVIKARSFEAGQWPSPVASRVYHFLDASTRDFHSNLPLMILSTGGRPIAESIAPGMPRTPGSLVVVDAFRGRSSLGGSADFVGLAEFEVFGQTSAGFEKKPYRIEIQDELRNDRKVPLLGMPAEADWRLRNPYNDKGLMNDFLALELHEQMGHYAVRRRFVEVFVDANGGKVRYPQDYVGVMVLMESIEAGPNRVAIQEVTPYHTTEPEISGGYVWKKEKDSVGDVNFFAAGQNLKIHEPKPSELRTTRVPSTALWPGAGYTPAASNQLSYLVSYLNNFNTSMLASNWLTRTGTNHYSHYIDVDSFVDQHWIVEFTKNIDGYRLGNYMQKDRGGKIKMDPIWDWELSFGNADYLDGGHTNTWYYPQIADADHIWLRRLMGGSPLPNSGGDPDFIQRVIDRWGVLRTNALNGPRVVARIDEIAGQLTDQGAVASAVTRNFTKYNNLNTYVWPNPGGAPTWDVDYIQPTYGGIISEIKKWTMGRYLWIDSQFPKAPTLNRGGGDIAAGTSIDLSAPAGIIYYTLDGTDPRLSRAAGAVAPGALTYSGPFVLNDNARVFARARVGNVWSPPIIETYVVRRPPLVITEIMYHPLPGGAYSDEEFEFIEFANVGEAALNLAGFTLSGGVEFAFPALSLPAGQRVVVVRNQTAFNSRYGSGVLVAGEFTGSLANEGERLVLRGGLHEPILDFEYDDRWHPITDGFGFSLVIVDEHASPDTWSLASSWRPSGQSNGTPGQSDGVPPGFPYVVINEARTHSAPPDADVVELLNLSGEPANIGGWYLTDDFRSPKKFRISLNTTAIPAGGFLTFGEAVFSAGATGFTLSAAGDELHLFSANAAGELTGYVHGFAFGAQRSGVTFIRHVTSEGQERFVASSAPTLGAVNAPPLVGPVVISEIMYHPPDVFAHGAYWNNVEDEYIELHNLTGAPVSLFDPARPANVWKLVQAVEFEFPLGALAPAGGFVIVVPFNPATDPGQLAAFRSRYGVSPGVPIHGPYAGKLSNQGETLALVLPDVREGEGAHGPVHYVEVDSVRYLNQSPWPVAADGAGQALHRLNPPAYGNDPVQWAAGDPTPGALFIGGSNPVVTTNPTNTTIAATLTASFTGAGSGPGPLRYQWRHNGVVIGGATNATLVLSNVQASKAGQYQFIVLNSFGSAVSTEATLTVLVPVNIIKDTFPQFVKEGSNATFTVVAESFNPPLHYQWVRNGVPIPGATSSTYVLNHAGEADDGAVFVARLTDGSGTFLSSEALLTVLIPPQLVEPVPKLNLTAVVGETVVLGARLRGTKPLWMDWRKFSPTGVHQGLLKSGLVNAGQDYLTLTNIGPNAAGIYCVLFTNIAGGSLTIGRQTNAVLVVLADSNSNGIPDNWESQYFGSPTAADRNADSDGDTMSNWAEYIAGTNPIDPDSFLKLQALATDETVSVRVGTVSNRTYTVQYLDALGTGGWHRLADLTARTTNRVETVIDPDFTDHRFYRVVTPRQP